MVEKKRTYEAKVKSQEQVEIERQAKLAKEKEVDEQFWAELGESSDPADNLTAFSDYL